MSERDGRSVSNRSLLLEANALDVEEGAVRNALKEYHRIFAQIQAEEEQLSALRQLLSAFSKSNNSDSEKATQYRNDARGCVDRISKYDRQLLNLEAKALAPLLRTLKDRAFQELQEEGERALQEYRRQAEAEQERITQEWREKRQAAEKKARQKQIGAIEAEIAQTKQQAQSIHEAIAKLGACWFGNKRKEKARLEAELETIQNKLMRLHNTRQQLKNNVNSAASTQTEKTPAVSEVDKLAEQVACSPNNYSAKATCEYLGYSELTKADTAIFACFLMRAICLGSASSRESAQNFSDVYVRAFKRKACSMYFKNDHATFERMFANRTSFYDRVYLSKHEIEDKLSAIIEEFEIIIKSDIVNKEYSDFSEKSPLPILSDGIFGDMKCRMEVISFYQQLPEMLSSQLEKVQRIL